MLRITIQLHGWLMGHHRWICVTDQDVSICRRNEFGPRSHGTTSIHWVRVFVKKYFFHNIVVDRIDGSRQSDLLKHWFCVSADCARMVVAKTEYILSILMSFCWALLVLKTLVTFNEHFRSLKVLLFLDFRINSAQKAKLQVQLTSGTEATLSNLQGYSRSRFSLKRYFPCNLRQNSGLQRMRCQLDFFFASWSLW